jgi:hypothetical protein
MKFKSRSHKGPDTSLFIQLHKSEKGNPVRSKPPLNYESERGRDIFLPARVLSVRVRDVN